jgi:hypothetical protein
MSDHLRNLRDHAGEEALLEVMTGLYDEGEVRCAEGRLRIAPIVDTDEIRLRGPSARDYSVRFPDARLVELITQSRVPVSEELVRVLLCLIYHHPERHAWATKERPERYRESGDEPRTHRSPPGPQ